MLQGFGIMMSMWLGSLWLGIWKHPCPIFNPLPCLARIHVRCQNIFLPPNTAVWGRKHIVLTAEHNVLLHFRESPERGPGVFGAAASVRIEAGTIAFVYSHMEPFRGLAYMLCPDTLGEAVLETGMQRRRGVYHRVPLHSARNGVEAGSACADC